MIYNHIVPYIKIENSKQGEKFFAEIQPGDYLKLIVKVGNNGIKRREIHEGLVTRKNLNNFHIKENPSGEQTAIPIWRGTVFYHMDLALSSLRGKLNNKSLENSIG